MKRFLASLLLLSAGGWAMAAGCATGGSPVGEEGGFGGAGGFGGSSDAATTDGPATGTGGDPSTSSTGGSTSTTGSTSAGSTSTSSTSASTSASTGTGMGCGAQQHFCGGLCAGNTPQTGCYGSASCAPCPAAPVHGTLTCSAAGQCDFTCSGGYVKSGSVCMCGAGCCSDADCSGGDTCQGGACKAPPPPPCDQNSCLASCVATCIFQGKVGLGICTNGVCNCVCQ